MRTRPHDKLLGIQAARGLAALVVAIYHGGHMLSLERYVGYVPLGGFFNFGHAGVDFFFVLSGFIIFMVHRGDIGHAALAPRYAWRRVTRVYPIYWVVTAALLVLAVLAPGSGHGVGPWHLIASLLLIPHGQDPVVGVAWTLEHEMLFYLLFGLCILNRRIGLIALATWFAITAVTTAVRPDSEVLAFLATSYHFQFLFGMGAAWVVIHRRVPAPLLLAALGFVGFVLVGMSENAGIIGWAKLPSQLLFGSMAVLVLIGLSAAEIGGSLRVGRFGAFFGAVSYVLYLVHITVIGLLARTLESAGLVHSLPGWALLLLVVLAACAVASAVHLLIEAPLIRRLRQPPAFWRFATSVPGPR